MVHMVFHILSQYAIGINVGIIVLVLILLGGELCA